MSTGNNTAGFFLFKNGLKVRKEHWRVRSVRQVRGFLQKQKAIYLTPNIRQTPTDTKSWRLWLIMDVESDEHNNISANIKAACELYAELDAHSLLDGLQIVLTGRGFRFIYPYFIEKHNIRAFKAWTKQHQYIDAAIYSAFVKVFDSKCYLLEDAADIFRMDAEAYIYATKELNDHRQVAKIALPTEPQPTAWLDFLQEYSTRLKLEDSVIALSITKASNSGQSILSYLKRNAIRYEDRGSFFKLSRCPACGRPDASPYVTKTGRLRCFHANTCPAGSDGLLPADWLPDWHENGTGTLDAGNTSIRNPSALTAARTAIYEALRSKKDCVISCTPGSGKTHQLLKYLQENQDVKTLVAAGTNRLADEILNNLPAKRLEGRNKDNCVQSPKAERLAKHGFSPGAILCPKCPRKDDCIYNQQFQQLPTLVLCTHAMLSYRAELQQSFKNFIFDENATNAFAYRSECRLEDIINFFDGLPSKHQAVAEKIKDCTEKAVRTLKATGKTSKVVRMRLYSGEPPEEASGCADVWQLAGISKAEKQSAFSDISAAYEQGDFETYSQYQRRLVQRVRSFNAVRWMLAANSGVGQTYVEIEKNERVRFVHFELRKPKIPDNARVVLLDGTGDIAEAETLFKRTFKEVNEDVELPNCRKVHLQLGLGKVKSARRDETWHRKTFEKALKHLQEGTHKVLVLTHQKIEDTVREIATESLKDKKIDVIHFFSNRGLNRWADFNAVIAYGTPTANQTDLLDLSVELFPDAAKRKQWRLEVGEKDLVQNVHRIRPVNGNKTIIIVGNQWPVELGRPDYTVNLKRTHGKGQAMAGKHNKSFMEAVTRCSAFMELHGFITKEIGWLLGIGTVNEKDRLLFYKQKAGDLSWLPEVTDKAPVILHDWRAWLNVLEAVRQKFQDAPVLYASGRQYGHKKTKGLGTEKAVIQFYCKHGFRYEPKSWFYENEFLEAKTAVF